MLLRCFSLVTRVMEESRLCFIVLTSAVERRC